MSNPTQDPQGEQPAAETLETAGTPPVDTAAIQSEIDNANPEELAKALGFDFTDTDTSQDDDDPPAQGNPPADSAPGAQPDGEAGQEAAPQTDPDTKPVSRRRLSVAGLPDAEKELNAKAIDLVREGKAANLFEAMKSLVGDAGSPDPANGDDPPAGNDAPDTRQAEAPPTLQQLEDRFETASEELAAAIRDFDQEKQIELNKEIAILNRQILRAEQAEATQKVEVSNYQSEYAEAVTEMESKYAELLDDENSPFADLLEDRIEAAKARRDPALSDPRHVLTIADDLADLLKVAAAPKERTPVADPPRRAPVGGGVAPAGKAKVMLTTKQAQDYIEKAPTDVLAAALWG
jgi:hypothetical protein